MVRPHRIRRTQLVRFLEEARFEHLNSAVHVLGTETGGGHELAGVSLYSSPDGWTAQVNWRAIIGSDEITLRVGDADSGEHAYEIRDERSAPLRVVDDDGKRTVSDDEVSVIISQSPLAKAWERDVVTVLKETPERQATVH